MFEKYFTPKDLAAIIRDGHAQGIDMTEIHQTSDEIKAAIEAKAKQAQSHNDFKAAILTAKTSPGRPRPFAVAYRNPRGAVKIAHGTHWSDGTLDVERGHGNLSGHEDSMNDLHKTAKNRHGNSYHIDYTDEP